LHGPVPLHLLSTSYCHLHKALCAYCWCVQYVREVAVFIMLLCTRCHVQPLSA
jgi:hypothetical protein